MVPGAFKAAPGARRPPAERAPRAARPAWRARWGREAPLIRRRGWWGWWVLRRRRWRLWRRLRRWWWRLLVRGVDGHECLHVGRSLVGKRAGRHHMVKTLFGIGALLVVGCGGLATCYVGRQERRHRLGSGRERRFYRGELQPAMPCRRTPKRTRRRMLDPWFCVPSRSAPSSPSTSASGRAPSKPPSCRRSSRRRATSGRLHTFRPDDRRAPLRRPPTHGNGGRCGWLGGRPSRRLHFGIDRCASRSKRRARGCTRYRTRRTLSRYLRVSRTPRVPRRSVSGTDRTDNLGRHHHGSAGAVDIADGQRFEGPLEEVCYIATP